MEHSVGPCRFLGLLLPLDIPSDRSPKGSRGHRISVSRAVAERISPSLMSKPLTMESGLCGHGIDRIGVITRAWTGQMEQVAGQVAGQVAEIESVGPVGEPVLGLYVAGVLVEPAPLDIQACAADLAGGMDALGLSFAATQVVVEDYCEHVWRVADGEFTGAAVLRRDKGAYQSTWIKFGRASDVKAIDGGQS